MASRSSPNASVGCISASKPTSRRRPSPVRTGSCIPTTTTSGSRYTSIDDDTRRRKDTKTRNLSISSSCFRVFVFSCPGGCWLCGGGGRQRDRNRPHVHQRHLVGRRSFQTP